MKDKERINISITPRADCPDCEGKGMVRRSLQFNGTDYRNLPNQFCDCVVEQVPNDEEDYDITLGDYESYTPGPWTACDVDGKYFPHVNLGLPVPYDDGSGFHQPSIVVNTSRLQTMKGAIANAFLIAAAPDLLTACRFALSVQQSQGVVDVSEKLNVERLEAAIAKAEGNPSRPPLPDEDPHDRPNAETCPHGYGFVEYCPDCNPLAAELRNIANAKYSNFDDAESFRAWAQSRARHALNEYAKKKRLPVVDDSLPDEDPADDDYDYAADDRNYDAARERRSK